MTKSADAPSTATRRIEVFRPGTFTAMGGETLTYTAEDLAAIAEGYDAAGAPAPIVVGHPSHDSPAFGWIKGFAVERGKLVAEVGDIAPEFAEAVAAGRYKKVSMAFFRPEAGNNPTPGSWYPKHLGFLGGAAPAVSGLKPVDLAGDPAAEVIVEFADATALRDVAGLFRSLREWIIEKFDLDVADKALPGWTIGWIEDAAERDPIAPAGAGFADPDVAARAPRPPAAATPEAAGAAPLSFSASHPGPVGRKPERAPAGQAAPAKAIGEANSAVSDKETAMSDDTRFAEREAALEKRARDLDHRDHEAFAEGLVADGRLLPVLKDKVIALLDGLPANGAIAFAEGGKEETSSPRDLVRDILEAQPKVATYGEQDMGDEAPAVEFAAPDGREVDGEGLELHGRALAFQRQHPGTAYLDAVRAVQVK